MNTMKIVAAAAVSLLTVFGAQAETYQGVEAPVSANARADVRAQAVIAAHSEDPYAEGASSHVAAAPVGLIGRGAVRSSAVAAAHGPDPYAEGYGQGVVSMSSSAVDRTAVRAQARAAAHGQQLPL